MTPARVLYHAGAVMLCRSCGQPLDPGARLCPNCGLRFYRAVLPSNEREGAIAPPRHLAPLRPVALLLLVAAAGVAALANVSAVRPALGPLLLFGEVILQALVRTLALRSRTGGAGNPADAGFVVVMGIMAVGLFVILRTFRR